MPSISQQDAQAFFDRLSQQYGAGVEPGDVADLMRRNPEDLAQVMRDFEAQYQRRGGSGGPLLDSTYLSQHGVGNVQAAPPPPPPEVLGNVITMGASAIPQSTALTSGPTGTIYPMYGAPASSGLSMTTLLVLAAVAAAAIYFLTRGHGRR